MESDSPNDVLKLICVLRLCRHLQSDIDNISDWVSCNHLICSIRTSVYKTLTIGTLFNQYLMVETFKFLGVLLFSELSWSAHIESICTKVRNLSVYYSRRLLATLTSRVCTIHYTHAPSSRICYSLLGSMYTLSINITKLENVQKLAMKMLPGST